MKQKIDKPDAKNGWWTKIREKMSPDLSELIDAAVILFLVAAAICCIIGIIMAAWDQHEIQKTMKPVPAEQRQPMIEIPIERTVCVKPAEGYCMEYRTNRIRTP